MHKVETVSVEDSAREIIPMLLRLCNEDEELLKKLVFAIYKQIMFQVNPTKKNGG